MVLSACAPQTSVCRLSPDSTADEVSPTLSCQHFKRKDAAKVPVLHFPYDHCVPRCVRRAFLYGAEFADPEY